MTWKPILEGELAERARGVIRQFAEAFPVGVATDDDSVIFWSYMAAADETAETAARHEAAMEQFSRRIEKGFSSDTLYGSGAAGVGWVAAHVADGADELLDVIDRLLLRSLEIEKWERDYDLISGLVGLGVYFLERGDAPQAREGLDRIVGHLERNATRTGDHVTWHTAPELLPPHQRETSPKGYYNCGLAHGVPGPITLLARIAERDPTPRVVELRDGAVRWLRAQRVDLPHSFFPTLSLADGSGGARTAWCYGDPGVLLALYRAAPSQEVIELAVAALTRPFERSGVSDAPLCHGASGLAHIANRFYQATGDARFLDAARTWFERTLAMQKPGTGIAGYQAYFGAYAGNAARWDDKPDFLDGSMGIGLALLGATTEIEPLWDRLLLCDLPVRE